MTVGKIYKTLFMNPQSEFIVVYHPIAIGFEFPKFQRCLTLLNRSHGCTDKYSTPCIRGINFSKLAYYRIYW